MVTQLCRAVAIRSISPPFLSSPKKTGILQTISLVCSLNAWILSCPGSCTLHKQVWPKMGHYSRLEAWMSRMLKPSIHIKNTATVQMFLMGLSMDVLLCMFADSGG